MGLIDDLLSHFGRYIERRPTNPNVRQVTSTDSIGEHFDRAHFASKAYPSIFTKDSHH
jgi:hypothetical protein